jgi:3-oxoacyl-(acyl-carrier-protein) synthase
VARGAKYIVKLVEVECLLMPITPAPHPEVRCKNVMLNCLRDAGLKPADVDGLNMHASLGDLAESKPLSMFLENMPIA